VSIRHGSPHFQLKKIGSKFQNGKQLLSPKSNLAFFFIVLDFVYEYQMTCIKETSLIEWKSNYGWTDGQTWKKLMVSTYIITGIRLAAILVIMSVSTFKTAVIL
jgi:hypothetical protein